MSSQVYTDYIQSMLDDDDSSAEDKVSTIEGTLEAVAEGATDKQLAAFAGEAVERWQDSKSADEASRRAAMEAEAEAKRLALEQEAEQVKRAAEARRAAKAASRKVV